MKTSGSMLLLLCLSVGSQSVAAQINVELAGNPLTRYPNFEFVRAFNANAGIAVGVDPTTTPSVIGQTADIYVVEHQNTWTLGDPLVDAGAGAEVHTFTNTGITGNSIVVASAGELDSNAGLDIGVPYDVVVDLNRDGLLSAGDLLDHNGSEAGLYVMSDITALGPLATNCVNYSVSGVTPGFSRQITCYPTSLPALGRVPLVIISHGNGHQYTWYGFLQRHLASYGYVVMSHQDNTGPGIETASTTILQHTDAIIGQQSTISGGIFNNRMDTSRITWIGHSRGGEGVARAYDRIRDGSFVPSSYVLSDIDLISTIAPTDFLGTDSSNPHEANFHFLYGSSDGDVSGAPNNDVVRAFHIFERATDNRQSTYVQGADHNDFNCCGFNDFSGPFATEIGRTEAQQVQKAVSLAIIKHYIEGNIPAKDYLWRQYERFRPIGVSPDTIVVSEYQESANLGKLVIDDFQSNSSPFLSSGGGFTLPLVSNFDEGLLDDSDGSFSWVGTDDFNGMTRGRPTDSTRGAVFDAERAGGGTPLILWLMPGGSSDWTEYEYLSFRAAQGTRHPLTTAQLRDFSFYILVGDNGGGFGLLDVGAYGGGIEEPYQRSGSGSGTGWQNEFETIRVRIDDLARGNGAVASTLDLTDIRYVSFLLVNPIGNNATRLAVDELELTVD